jgi:hypothetical protein
MCALYAAHADVWLDRSCTDCRHQNITSANLFSSIAGPHGRPRAVLVARQAPAISSQGMLCGEDVKGGLYRGEIVKRAAKPPKGRQGRFPCLRGRTSALVRSGRRENAMTCPLSPHQRSCAKRKKDVGLVERVRPYGTFQVRSPDIGKDVVVGQRRARDALDGTREIECEVAVIESAAQGKTRPREEASAVSLGSSP